LANGLQNESAIVHLLRVRPSSAVVGIVAVVTHVRNIADVGLEVRGPNEARWMTNPSASPGRRPIRQCSAPGSALQIVSRAQRVVAEKYGAALFDPRPRYHSVNH
jgi:hypothetical protein